MKYHGAGVYALYNVMKNKIYIGISTNIESRFSSHRSNFRTHSESNPMYDEPIDDFAFLILQKMKENEYKKYGSLMEFLFVIQAQKSGMEVYNQNKLQKDATNNVLGTLKVEEMLYGAIREKLNVRPWTIKMMNEKSKRSLCDNMKHGGA